MRTIEIFSSLGEHLFEDQAVRKYGLILAKNGLKGIKAINPAVLWIDAGLSLVEAGNSYLKYAKECEITKQIKLENEVLEQQLDAQLKKLKINNIQEYEKGKTRIEELNRHSTLISVNNKSLVKEIELNLNSTKRMLKILKEERENIVDFDVLQKFQIALDGFIRASLMCLIYSVDNIEAMVD